VTKKFLSDEGLFYAEGLADNAKEMWPDMATEILIAAAIRSAKDAGQHGLDAALKASFPYIYEDISLVIHNNKPGS